MKWLVVLLIITAVSKAQINEPCNNGTGKCLKIPDCPPKFIENTLLIDIRVDEEEIDCIDYLLVCCRNDQIPPEELLKENSDPQTCNDGQGNCVHPSLCTSDNAEIWNNNCPDPSSVCCPVLPSNELEPPREVPKCGFRNIDGVKFGISGDTNGEAQYAEFPWMVIILREAIFKGEEALIYKCGGVLILPKIVLTVAHCLDGKPIHDLIVRLGEWDTETSNEIYPYQDRRVVAKTTHPEYYPAAFHYDVSLLVLDQPVDLGPSVGTICLPSHGIVMDTTKCVASGWGKDKFGEKGVYQNILKKMILPVTSNDQCEEKLKSGILGPSYKLHHSLICAGGNSGVGACHGDGGSPLVCEILGSRNRYALVGIVVWGPSCGEDYQPTLFTNISLIRTWVDSQLAEQNISSDFYKFW